jgi:hypothetical protein
MWRINALNALAPVESYIPKQSHYKNSQQKVSIYYDLKAGGAARHAAALDVPSYRQDLKSTNFMFLSGRAVAALRDARIGKYLTLPDAGLSRDRGCLQFCLPFFSEDFLESRFQFRVTERVLSPGNDMARILR